MQAHIHSSQHNSWDSGDPGPVKADRTLSLISNRGLNFHSVAVLFVFLFCFCFLKSTLSRKDAPQLHVLCHLQQQRQPHDPKQLRHRALSPACPCILFGHKRAVMDRFDWKQTWTQRLHCPEARRDGCREEFERHRIWYICCFSMKLYTLLQIISSFLSMFQHFGLKLKSP